MSIVMQLLKRVNFKWHILSALIVRLFLIIYSTYHDEVSVVPYTDVDYKVFTDASRHILNYKSPYDRNTYRYTPLIALILLPNVVLHNSFGKLFFSLVDLLVGLLIRVIVKSTLGEYQNYKQNLQIKKTYGQLKGKISDASLHPEKNTSKYRLRKKPKLIIEKCSFTKKPQKSKSNLDITADIAMLVWLYNPLTVAIATRGNCDSIAGCLVLATMYFLQCRRQYFIAGLLHGLAIHVRLYPIAYSLAFFMYLSDYSYYFVDSNKKQCKRTPLLALENKSLIAITNNKSDNSFDCKYPMPKTERKTILKKEYLLYLLPNFNQLKLISGCLLSLSFLTVLFYYLYGYTFLYETYIYHLIRKDTRHNFSLYFYLQYLTAGIKNIGIWQKVLIVLPQVVLLLLFSFRYGINKFSLNFSILTQTIVMITYNTVLTSQYFVWIMSVLPLCLWQINMTKKTATFLFIIWFAAQVSWLLPAYFLEFHGQNTFMFIWVQSVSFFCANIAILGRLIMNFMSLKTG